MTYEDYTNAELREQHEELLRLQKQDLAASHQAGAREMARERQLVWNEAQDRGISLEAER